MVNITYKGTQNLAAQKESLGSLYDEKVKQSTFFLELYYTSEQVKMEVKQEKGSDNYYVAHMNDIIYTQGKPVMYSLDSKRSIVFEINVNPFSITPTGEIKKFLILIVRDMLSNLLAERPDYGLHMIWE